MRKFKSCTLFQHYICYRFGLDKDWNKLTIFILNLATCDFLYCSICLPFYSSLYIGNKWLFGERWCRISVVLAFIFGSTDWMGVALIALSRASLVAFPSFSNKVYSKGKSKYIILFVWIAVIVNYVPSYFEVFISTNNLLLLYKNITKSFISLNFIIYILLFSWPFFNRIL